MRLTEAQIRRTVRSILNEAFPAYPEPDRGISKIIDTIGLKLKAQAESDPDFEPMRNVAERGALFTRTSHLVEQKYKREVDQICRLMVRQAQKLVPAIEETLPDIAASLTPGERDLYNVNQFRGIDSESAEGSYEYHSFSFDSVTELQTSVIIALVYYIFPTPATESGFEDDRLSRYTDSRVYGSLLRLFGYHPPGFRSTMQARMNAVNNEMEGEPGIFDAD